MAAKQQPEDFAAWTQRVMDERGWSQQILAKRMGVSPAEVSRVFKRERLPGIDFLRGFATATGYDVIDVLICAGWLPAEKDGIMSQSDKDTLALFKTLSEEERAMILKIMRGLNALRAE